MGRGGSDLEALLAPSEPAGRVPSAASEAPLRLCEEPSWENLQELLRWRNLLPALSVSQAIEVAVGKVAQWRIQQLGSYRSETTGSVLPAMLSSRPWPEWVMERLLQTQPENTQPDQFGDGLFENIATACPELLDEPLDDEAPLICWAMIARELSAVQPADLSGESSFSPATWALLRQREARGVGAQIREGAAGRMLFGMIEVLGRAQTQAAAEVFVDQKAAESLASSEFARSITPTLAAELPDLIEKTRAPGLDDLERPVSDRAFELWQKRFCEQIARSKKFQKGDWLFRAADSETRQKLWDARVALTRELGVSIDLVIGSPELEKWINENSEALASRAFVSARGRVLQTDQIAQRLAELVCEMCPSRPTS